MKKDLFDKKDIFINKEFENTDSYYEFVCQHLEKELKIDSNYLSSIENREKSFPTGLKTGKICVAIPHTDYQHSKTSQLVVTTLKKPLKFRQMDDPNSFCDVNIVIQILFDTPDKQLSLLKNLMKLIQDQEFLQKIKNAKDKSQIINAFIGG